MFRLKKGDKIALISCSDGLKKDRYIYVDKIRENLHKIGLELVVNDILYEKDGFFSGTGKERADALMEIYEDKNISAIFDISGGESSNHLLPYLDFDIIKKNYKPYFGISDLTVLLNSIYAKTNLPNYHYRPRNLADFDYKNQLRYFENSLMDGKQDIFNLEYRWIRGLKMSGVLIGGNIRCLLKLAGTECMPDFKDKILLLESLGGTTYRHASLIHHLKTLGVFEKINGIILGRFTIYDKAKEEYNIEDLITQYTKEFNIPIVRTKDIGHNHDSLALIIGEKICLEKK